MNSRRRYKVLLVEDVAETRVPIVDIFEKWFNYEVIGPSSFVQMKDTILHENFDSILVDKNLSCWTPPFKINGTTVNDGLDVAKYVHSFQENSRICLYTSMPEEQNIDKSPFEMLQFDKIFGPDPEKIKKQFDPFRTLTEEDVATSPLEQSISFYTKPVKKRMQIYRQVTRYSHKWIEKYFNSFKELSWVFAHGQSIIRGLVGPSIENNVNSQEFNGYPTIKSLKNISGGLHYAPLIFWNTNSFDKLNKQRKLAGESLRNIPQPWRCFFSISVTEACVRAYLEGKHKYVLTFCQEFDDTGKLQILLAIYNRLADVKKSALSYFEKICRKYDLPIIFDCFLGRVDEIDDSSSSVFVELKSKRDQSQIVAESFDRETLLNVGVKYVDQAFLYCAYEPTAGGFASFFDPV